MIVINKNTGEYLYTTSVEVDIMKDEMLINEILTENFENPYFDFKTYKFYGNLKVESINVEEPTREELISQKEDELISIYDEIQKLKNDSKN
jgi:hypothetical protein